MTSIRHNTSDEPYLDAARDNILAVGWRRTTLTDIARRAGVSRMTIYRRWPDMQALLADLLVREWGGLIDDSLLDLEGSQTRATIVEGVTGTVAKLRENPVFMRILEVDPELLLPYLLERRGRNQDLVLDLLSNGIRRGQADGTVRDGDPELLSRALLLALHGFVISRPTMSDTPSGDLDHELAVLVERYLQP
jgi:AcrR family transcriptional regulator